MSSFTGEKKKDEWEFEVDDANSPDKYIIIYLIRTTGAKDIMKDGNAENYHHLNVRFVVTCSRDEAYIRIVHDYDEKPESVYYYICDDDDDDDDLNGDIDEPLDEYAYHMSIPTHDQLDATDNTDRFKCVCGKSYKEERYRRYHRKWECGKLPTFNCPHCGYSAKRKNSLKQHIERRHFDIAFTKIIRKV